MISLLVSKMEVTGEGAFVTFRAFASPENLHEFRLEIPRYELKIWGESVGSIVNLDPRIMANESTVYLTPPEKAQ